MHGNRRTILRLMGVDALLPALDWQTPLGAARQLPHKVPQGDYILARRVEGELFDSRKLIVERTWRCGFEGVVGGMAVRGTQMACTVDAPPKLAPLAAMERDRIDNGPFPALIDANGRIAEQSSEPSADFGAVVDQAVTMLAASGQSAAELGESRRFLDHLAGQTAEALGTVPPDLFFPEVQDRSAVRKIDLPGDTQGSVEIRVAAEADQASGLLISLKRTLVTRLGQDVRINREEWHLSRA